MRIDRALRGLALAAMLLCQSHASADDATQPPDTRPANVIIPVRAPEFSLTALNDPQDGHCRLKRIESYPLIPDNAGHVAVPVMLDKPRLLLVDTGGVRSVLFSSVARDMGLQMAPIRGEAEVNVAGTVNDKVVLMPTMSFGIIRFHQAVFTLDDDGGREPVSDNALAGTLGPTHLMSFDVEFDFAKKRMNLYSQDHCPGAVVYWARDYVTVPFKIVGQTHIQFPMTLEGREVDVELDTGSPESFLNMSTANDLFGIDEKSLGVEPAGYLTRTTDEHDRIYTRYFNRLALDGIEIRNPKITLLPDRVRENTHRRVSLVPMVLGLRELSALHIYIAYKEGVIYATAADTTSPAPVQESAASTK